MDPATILTAAGVLATLIGAAVISRPHLRKEIYTDHSLGTFTIILKNTGTGGATILSMEVNAYGVSSNDCDVDEFVTRIARPINMNGNPSIEFNIYDKGDNVAPNDSLKVLEVKVPKAKNDLDVTFSCLKKNVCLKGRYKSILGQRFRIK